MTYNVLSETLSLYTTTTTAAGIYQNLTHTCVYFNFQCRTDFIWKKYAELQAVFFAVV